MEISPTLTASADKPHSIHIESLVNTLGNWQRRKLYANLHKGLWYNVPRPFLFQRLLEELEEFCNALEAKVPSDEVWKEVADCANILAFIADNYEAAYGEATTPEREPEIAAS